MEENQGEGVEQISKKPKTKVVNRKGDDGWVTVTVVDEEGKSLEKPKTEEKTEKKPEKKNLKKNRNRQKAILLTTNQIICLLLQMKWIMYPHFLNIKLVYGNLK